MNPSPKREVLVICAALTLAILAVYGTVRHQEFVNYDGAYYVIGNPVVADISTSYVESQNLTMRMHIRRLTRLTNALSKKLENSKATVGLHFGYYNFVRTHKTLHTTPAVAAGVIPESRTVVDLTEKTED